MAIAALVLGILGTIFAIIPLMFWLGLILSLVGLILAIVGRSGAKKAAKPTGTATAGLVLSLVGTALSALMWVWCGLAIHNAEKNVNKALQGVDDKKLNEEFNKVFEKALEESQKHEPPSKK